MAKRNATKVVTSALLGYDYKTIEVGGNFYVITPPTIAQIAGAGYYLSDFDEEYMTMKDVIKSMKDIKKACKALSYFINKDESLATELEKGTIDEVVNGLCTAFELVSVVGFTKLSALAKSVGKMIARQRI